MVWIFRTITIAVIATSGPLLAGQAAAQWAPKPPSSTPAEKAPNTSAPDQTTATFGDWTLRCDRRPDLTPPQRICELVLSIQKPGESAAQAQVAIGRVAAGQALRVTVALPPNVALKSNPRMVIEGQRPLTATLSWTRCIAGACFADAELSSELLDILRSRTEPARLDYRDGTEREVSQSVSFRGVRPALDALAREEAR